jgi:fructose-specific phosphotransferase system IIA component
MKTDNIVEQILEENLIKLDLNVSTKEEAISELAEIMFRNNKLFSREGYIKDVLEREKCCTTGIGCEIAIPHCKSDDVRETSIVIGRFLSPIEWDSLDGRPVTLVFLVAVRKKDAAEMHLKILSFIASQLMEEEIVKGLLNARTPEKVITLLGRKDSIESR